MSGGVSAGVTAACTIAARRLGAWLLRPEAGWRAAALLVAGLVLVAGKQAYRDASASDLSFLLAPTAELVSLVCGTDFVHEAGTGWVSRELMFIIAPACAGVNFALAAFLALTLGWLGTIRTGRDLAARLLAASVLTYAAALVVNTVRITIAIALHRGALPDGGLTPDDVHRIEGVLIYAGGLCAFYRLARGGRGGRGRERAEHAAAA